MTLKVFFALLMLTVGVVTCLGQAKTITSEEYFDVYAGTIQKVLDTTQRRTKKEETFKAGKLVRVEEELEERQGKDFFRFVYSEKIGLREKRNEYSEINGTFYCRQNRGKWRKSNTDCSTAQLLKIVSGDSDAKDTFTYEEVILNGKKLKLYTQNTTYSGKTTATNTAPAVLSTENKIWINDGGLISKREYRVVFSGNKNYRLFVETYDYEAKFSTAPPIK